MCKDQFSAGARLWIKGGTYAGDFDFLSSGATGNPIVIRPVPGERVIVDGSMIARGANIHWHEIEFCYTGFTDRESSEAAASPTDINGKQAFYAVGSGGKLINCILRDSQQGYAGALTIDGYEVYGCLCYYNGWINTTGISSGHGIYPHNIGNVPLLLRDNIVFSNFGFGLHAYTSTFAGATLNNLIIQGNVSFENGVFDTTYHANLLIGAESDAVSGFDVRDNYLYHSNLKTDVANRLGYVDGPLLGDLDCRDNVFVAAGKVLRIGNISGAVEDNVIVGTLQDFEAGDYPGNNYAASYAGVHVRPNLYKSGRANVAIYNPTSAVAVEVDLSSVTGLSAGDTVSVHNVEDYWTDIQTLVLDGDKKIVVNMEAVNRTVVAPVGWHAPATVFPLFGAFVVEKA